MPGGQRALPSPQRVETCPQQWSRNQSFMSSSWHLEIRQMVGFYQDDKCIYIYMYIYVWHEYLGWTFPLARYFILLDRYQLILDEDSNAPWKKGLPFQCQMWQPPLAWVNSNPHQRMKSVKTCKQISDGSHHWKPRLTDAQQNMLYTVLFWDFFCSLMSHCLYRKQGFGTSSALWKVRTSDFIYCSWISLEMGTPQIDYLMFFIVFFFFKIALFWGYALFSDTPILYEHDWLYPPDISQYPKK